MVPKPQLEDRGGQEEESIATRTRKRLREEEAEGYVPPGSYLVEDILKHRYHHYHQFLVKWQGYAIADSTWEPVKAFVLEDGSLNDIFMTYCQQKGLQRPLQQATRIGMYRRRKLEQQAEEGDVDGDPFLE